MDSSKNIGGVNPPSTTPFELRITDNNTNAPNVRSVESNAYVGQQQAHQDQDQDQDQDNNISKTRSVAHLSDNSREKACQQKLDSLFASLLPNAIKNLPNENISSITINGKIIYPRPTTPPITDEQYKKSMQCITNELTQNTPNEQEARSEAIQELKLLKQTLLKDMPTEEVQTSLTNLLGNTFTWHCNHNETYSVNGSLHQKMIEELKKTPRFVSTREAEAAEAARKAEATLTTPELTPSVTEDEDVDTENVENTDSQALHHHTHDSVATPATPPPAPPAPPASPPAPPPAPPAPSPKL